MSEYAPVLRIVRRGIYKNKIVWLQDFHAIPRKKFWTSYEILPNPVNTRFSGYLLTVPYCLLSNHDKTSDLLIFGWSSKFCFAVESIVYGGHLFFVYTICESSVLLLKIGCKIFANPLHMLKALRRGVLEAWSIVDFPEVSFLIMATKHLPGLTLAQLYLIIKQGY